MGVGTEPENEEKKGLRGVNKDVKYVTRGLTKAKSLPLTGTIVRQIHPDMTDIMDDDRTQAPKLRGVPVQLSREDGSVTFHTEGSSTFIQKHSEGTSTFTRTWARNSRE